MRKIVYAEELIKNIRKFKKSILPISEYYVGMEDACEVIIDMINAGAFEEEERNCDNCFLSTGEQCDILVPNKNCKYWKPFPQ